MTLQDLYKAVSQLGFEDSLGDDSTDRFIYAANRALLEIDALRPRRRSVYINHRVPENLLSTEPTSIERTEDVTFTAQYPKSFYFEVSGEGEFEIELEKKTKKVASDEYITEYITCDDTFSAQFNSQKFIPIRGFIKHNGAFIDKLSDQGFTGNVLITFKGDYTYTVRNLAMYGKVYSSKVSDIAPFGYKIGYKLSELVSDFGKLDTPPAFNGKQLTSGYSIESDTVFLPNDKLGIYTINYLHKVELIDLAAEFYTGSDPIDVDLDEDLAALLPNLIAAYVWLDDEADKSQYYYNLYLQRAEQLKRETRDLNPVEFQSVDGW